MSNKESPYYRKWTWIRQVKYNPNNPDYSWARKLPFDFDEFGDFEDYIISNLGPCPKNKKYLHRIDQKRGWVEGNLMWAEGREIGNNHKKSFHRFIKHNGEKLTLAQWAVKLGIKYQCLYSRMLLGWKPERMLSTPTRRKKRHVNKGKNT